jgi:hypothetical protein
MIKIKDDLTKNLIYKSYYDMVRDGKISGKEYVDFLIRNLKDENSYYIINI